MTPPLMHKTHHHFLRAAGEVAAASVGEEMFGRPPRSLPCSFSHQAAGPVGSRRGRCPAVRVTAGALGAASGSTPPTVLHVKRFWRAGPPGTWLRRRHEVSSLRLGMAAPSRRSAWLRRLSFTSGLRPQRPGKRCLGARGRLAVARRAANRPGHRPTTAAPSFFYIRMSSPPSCAAIPSGVTSW